MTGADIVAGILKIEGVDIMPCFPSSELIESAAKIGIRPIVVRQERQAVHIADGYARVTGGTRIAPVVVQAGPGSENAFGAVAQSFGDNVPLLHLPGGYDTHRQGAHPNFSAARAMAGIAKSCRMVPATSVLPQALANAFAQLRNGRPGPVVLELPDDVLAAEADATLLDAYVPQRRAVVYPDPGAIEEAAQRLAKAKAPVIVAGQGVLYGQATADLVRLVETLSIPVIATLNGKSAFPENHALYLGCGGRSQPDPVVDALRRCDLILGLGTSFTVSDYITPYPRRGRTFIQVTNCEADFAKDYPLHLPILGDVGLAVAALQEASLRLALPDRSAERAAIHASKRAFAERWAPIMASDEVPIAPYRVIHELMRACDRTRTVVTHDAGSPRDQTTATYEAIVPHGYIGWGKTTQLGLGLGLAQGAKLARPDWTAVNLMGDAAIGMVGMDIETGVRERIGTTTVVLNNGLMGIYSNYFPHASEHYHINRLGGSYAKLAEALGARGERVDQPGALAGAFARAFAANAEGLPALIEVMTCEERRLPLHPDLAELARS